MIITRTHRLCQRRTFFSSPFSKPNLQSYSERKVLPHSQSELYDIVANVESYPSFIPYCTNSRVIKRLSEKDGVSVVEHELTVGFLSFEERYVSRVTCRPTSSVQAVAASSTPLFTTLDTTWRFQPDSGSPRSTIVTLDITWAFANPIHAAVSSAFFGQVSKLMVGAFEKRALEVYGK